MSRMNQILAIGLGLQVLLAGFLLTRGESASIGALEPIVAMKPDEVSRIAITAGAPTGDGAATAAAATDGKPAIELRKQAGGWVLASHFDYPADPAKVKELVDKLVGMKSRGAVADGAARAKQLEVADGDFQRKLVVTAGGQDTTLFVGAAAGPRKAAVRLAGQDAIHGVPGITAYGVSILPSAYLDPVFAEVDEAKVAAIVITTSRGTFELGKSGGAWSVAIDGQPAAPPAGQELDTGKLDQLLKSAARIELAAPADPARTIARPEATITVRLAAAPASDAGPDAVSAPGDERIFELISDPDDRYLVREKGGPRAVLVDGWRLRELVDLDRTKLFKQPDAAPPPGMEAPPGGAGMDGLPPEILEQLRQQGAMP